MLLKCNLLIKEKFNFWGKVAIRRKRAFLFPSHLEEDGFLEVSIYIERNLLLFPVPNKMAPTLKRRKAAIQHVRLCSSSQQKSFSPLSPLRALCGFKRKEKLIRMHTTWQLWQHLPLPHLKKILHEFGLVSIIIKPPVLGVPWLGNHRPKSRFFHMEENI